MNEERIKRKLQESKKRQLKSPITSFQGPYRFLSNFWPAEIEFEGLYYPSVEHAYVAAKTIDLLLRKEIQDIVSPGDVKRFGRRLQLRSDWEENKLSIIMQLVKQKFETHPDLKHKLLETKGRELIEGNRWHDRFYGVCYCEKCKGDGLNQLGIILMMVREAL